MVLHTENRQLLVTNAFYRAIIEVTMRNLK